MHVEDHPGRELATVWLHHGVGSTRAWDSLLPASADGHRALVYDRNGFGRSTHERVFTTAMFDDDVEDLRLLLTARGLGPVHLVGHSDGGTVALLLAARDPALVASVAVAAVHVRGDAATVATLRAMGPPTEWPVAMRRSLERAHGADWADVAGRWHDLWVSPAWATWSIVDELASIQSPVLAVHGSHDALSPPLHAETIRDVVPGARVAWIDTATHDPHRADVERFNAELRTLWAAAEAARG
ncbi:MAG TPA: alpha/beta hydrolase [Candidatus Dormibacteraeota bacterium]